MLESMDFGSRNEPTAVEPRVPINSHMILAIISRFVRRPKRKFNGPTRSKISRSQCRKDIYCYIPKHEKIAFEGMIAL